MGETLKRGGTEKKGKKVLGRGDKLGQGVGVFRKVELEPPYELCQ